MLRSLGRLLLFHALAAATAAAQGGAVVVPAAWSGTDAPGLAFWPFAPFEVRAQLVVDGALLGSARNRPLASLTVRRNAGDPSPLDAGRVIVDVWLSQAQHPARIASSEFARNRGPGPTAVFGGVLDLPACPPAPQGPAPWLAPFAVQLPFATPTVVRGSGLCIETLSRPYRDPVTGAERAAWWPVDAFVRGDAGVVEPLGPSCVPGLGTAPARSVASTWLPGGTGVFFVEGPRPGAAVVGLVGVAEPHHGGIPLPLALDAIGAPGCVLQVDPFAAIAGALDPLAGGARGAMRVDLALPAIPSLPGARFAAQWVVVDPTANRLGLTATNAVRATVGSAPLDDGFAWLESTDLQADTGLVLRGRFPVVLIEHR